MFDPSFRGTRSPVDLIEGGAEGGGEEEVIVGAGIGDGPGHEFPGAGADFVGAGLHLLPEEAGQVGGFGVDALAGRFVILVAAGIDDAEEVPAEVAIWRRARR